jgi:protocatechuate 3,4-dioxygenase beta subunit
MREITRRQAVRVLGAAGASYIAAPSLLRGALTPDPAEAASTCAKLTPELTEGPYWINTLLRRADVRGNTNSAATAPGVRQQGVPLDLTIIVRDASKGCHPLSGVAVDIWHANAHGLYSDEGSQQAGGGTTGGDTSGQNYLRGYQITGKDRGLHRKPVAGQVSFKTIWPGWYTSRAIHIHVRVRRLSHSGATIAGYTTQIFFSDADNNRVLAGAAPYNARSPENDTVLQSADRATNIVAVKGSISRGFSATFSVILTDSEVGAAGSLAAPTAGGGPPGP